MSRRVLLLDEDDRHEAQLRAIAADARVAVDIHRVRTVAEATEAVKERWDAILLGCAQGPGLPEALSASGCRVVVHCNADAGGRSLVARLRGLGVVIDRLPQRLWSWIDAPVAARTLGLVG